MSEIAVKIEDLTRNIVLTEHERDLYRISLELEGRLRAWTDEQFTDTMTTRFDTAFRKMNVDSMLLHSLLKRVRV